MYDIDRTQAFVLIEARSQLAEDAFGLPGNAGFLVQPKQTQQPTTVAPSAPVSESALQLTLDKIPIDPNAGYLFGSSEKICDVLLDTVSDRGVGSKAFSIEYHHKTQDLILKCLAHNGIFYREDTEDLKLNKLTQGGRFRLLPGQKWIVVVGSIQIALSAVPRERSEQQAFDRNFKDYIGDLKKASPDAGKLNVPASGTFAMETPDTRVLTGIWGNYTAAGRVGEGRMACITACISKTGVTCCVKEAKEGKSKEAIRREIICIRRFAHPSIVQYIDRDQNFAWAAMEIANLGDLEQQHQKVRFTLRETEVVVYQVLHALDHVNSCDIIHHDIKPENILVQIRNSDQVSVKVADFGLASRISMNQARGARGSYPWLAPECYKRSATDWGPKVDIWALAMVALRLLFKLPKFPKETGFRDYTPRCPYAEGWGGALRTHFDNYVTARQGVSDPFCNTLSRMFDSEPEARLGASNACQSLRGHYPSGYFFSIGKRTPAITGPVSAADTRGNDASIFRFRELKVESIPEPLVMLEGCYLIKLRPIVVAKFGGTNIDVEDATYKVLARYLQYEFVFWRFKRTNELPETYISIELAMTICRGEDRLQRLLQVLRELRTLRDKSHDEEPGRSQLVLLNSKFTSHHIIAITEGGRMLLVRPRDGYIYGPSILAVGEERLLSTVELGRQSEYMPLAEAMFEPDIMSHDDIFSLGAATYSSY